jgi:general secretion pathway protein B
MSSILEALKKLEKEKIHRNEISTAIASDILRSSKKTSSPQWRIPSALFLLVIFVSGLTLFLTRTTVPAPVAPTLSQPVVKPVAVTVAQPVQVLAPQPVSAELPLLSGIVYQRQAEARMAILNDLPVMEGTVVAGYTLQEIFVDRVLLTRKGKSFSLFINP